MPVTRRSRTSRTNTVVNARSKENMDVQSTAENLQNKKRTIKNIEDLSSISSTPTALAASQGTSEQHVSKRTRTTGPSHGRPMQLKLAVGGEEGGLPQVNAIDNKVDNNKTSKHLQPQALKRTTSFYPGRHQDVPLFFTNIRPENEGLSNIHDGDTEVESEEEWLSVPQPLEPAAPASRKTKAMDLLAIERPVWKEPSPTTVSASAGSSTVAQDAVPTSQEPSVIVSNPGLPAWPTETDLIFLPGSNKVMLKVQRPLLRAVIQDGIEWTRANILISNAFPNAFETLEFVRDALTTAAGNNDQATDILHRLKGDLDYINNMGRLPRARIPLFRREVKDCCVAIVQAEFLAIGSNRAIFDLVEKQKANYNYTFPTPANGNPLNFLPMRTRPYRNLRIIKVIREMFFTGGMSSFANRFRDDFPSHLGNDGVEVREVPMAMVALVATALYAAITEWSTGTHRSIEFSANAFFDVYDGHMNTFHHVRKNRGDAFHVMMSDIYSQAIAPENGSSTAVMADIELDDIEC